MSKQLIIKPQTVLACVLFFVASSISLSLYAQPLPEIAGTWVINEKLSDNTDKQVEIAIRAAGGKVKRRWWFSKEKDIYRGGPIEQELYDRISYDRTLKIELRSPEFIFTYDDSFVRPVYTDNRSRSVSLNRLEDLKDFSFAHWGDNALLVEARPRDGGFANETYRLINNGTQLRVEMFIRPQSFQESVELVRIYDRAN